LESGHLSSPIPTISTRISKIIYVACISGKKYTNASKEKIALKIMRCKCQLQNYPFA
jgi:hypothetical protein